MLESTIMVDAGIPIHEPVTIFIATTTDIMGMDIAHIDITGVKTAGIATRVVNTHPIATADIEKSSSPLCL